MKRKERKKEAVNRTKNMSIEAKEKFTLNVLSVKTPRPLPTDNLDDWVFNPHFSQYCSSNHTPETIVQNA